MSPKHVFAHYMVGNTYPYTAREWEQDLVDCAERAALDGFVLNVGREEWQRDRVLDCFATALAMRSPLKFFLSFDMSSIPAATPADVDFLCDYMSRLAHHPNMFRYHGRVVVSTFAGEGATFGCSSLDEAWLLVKRRLGEYAPIFFMPAFFIDPARYPSLSSMDGSFHWNGGWPLHLSPTCHRREIEMPALDSDKHHLRHLGGRAYMAAVSPWFFTHYGADSWNKNWIYRGDDWLYVRRWEQIMSIRAQIDIVQVISWNDYGESHYIAPVRGAQPNSQAWVDGFPHDPWMTLTAYFARAFRDGHAPPILRDRIFMWARPHPRDAPADETIPRPANWELTDDKFWVVVLATAPAKVILSTGGDEGAHVSGHDDAPDRGKPSRSFTSRLKETFTSRAAADPAVSPQSSEPATYTVSAGLTKLSHALRPGNGMRAQMKRGGAVVAECAPTEFCFEATPSVHNFNAFVADSDDCSSSEGYEMS
ncbi:glycoside hydrolase family 71 protein [Schizophyllum amplum]|uniref:Glycoside hydrolase family 71 protein n=1 Tax=Schizophyllum amplum TaxID=97359 RepID=A0A550CVX8_9AGAR|nr:glycoside hydrolase family 71 protein [Auriculariopsis ampla]